MAFNVTDEEIALVGPILQRLSWADQETRKKIQKYGVNVLPINFYSNTPSIEEILNSNEYSQSTPPYLNETIFNKEQLRREIDVLFKYSHEFNPDIEGDKEKCRAFYWNNDQFSFSDAMAYYCYIRKIKPENIIEIGSGYSTLVALEAIKKNQCGKVHCIEPFPRPFLKNNSNINLLEKKVQDIDSQYLNSILQDNDILFIDSTHTVKTGSDCLHIYLDLLPKITKNIFVHIHEIFLPYGLPVEWLMDRQIFWTEQYLVMAFLIDNPKISVLFSSYYNMNVNQDKLMTLMGGKSDPKGASFWFEYKGDQDPLTTEPITILERIKRLFNL